MALYNCWACLTLCYYKPSEALFWALPINFRFNRIHSVVFQHSQQNKRFIPPEHNNTIWYCYLTVTTLCGIAILLSQQYGIAVLLSQQYGIAILLSQQYGIAILLSQQYGIAVLM